MMVTSKVLRYGMVVGAIYGTVAALHNNKWNVDTIGLVRFGRAASTVGQIVVDYKLSFHNVDPGSEQFKELKSQVHQRSASRLLALCCANGGVFIKVGQHMAALDYLLPKEYVTTLRVLHNKAPESSIESVYEVIREDLKQEPEELFASFDPNPIGAASLAQVYRAVTKEGDVVAVKVQHKEVKARSFIDMKTMEVLTHLVAKVFPEFQFLWLAEETKKNLPIELDFINEGKNAERVRRMFGHYKWFKVPRIYWNLSSERVLTMEYCTGGQVNDRKYMEEHNVPVQEVTRKLGIIYSEMIFVQGYVHCDPHPGNVLVDKSSGKVQIVLLDHGLYITLTDSFRLNYANMWLSLINADIERIKEQAAAMGVKGAKGELFASMLTIRSWKHVTSGIGKKEKTEDEDREIRTTVANYLPDIAEILNVVPREMLFIFKTNDLLHSIQHTLKSPQSASSFINMSRCCVKAIAQDRLEWCQSISCRIKVIGNKRWLLLKISLYELFVWFQNSLFGRFSVTSPRALIG